MTEDQKWDVPPFTWSNDHTVRSKRYHRYLDELEIMVNAEQTDDHDAAYNVTVRSKGNPRDVWPAMTAAQLAAAIGVVNLMVADFESAAPW